MQVFPFGTEQYFRQNLIKGQIAKELVKGLLENSGYHVYAFGYESSISQLRFDVAINKGRVPPTPSNDRIRSMPDLIVYDNMRHQTSFVEVKYRSVKTPEQVRLSTRELEKTKRYWNDSILIVVIPQEHNFYARKVSEIEVFDQLKSHQYNLLKDFKPIEQEYDKISSESIQRYKGLREHFLTPIAREDEDMFVE